MNQLGDTLNETVLQLMKEKGIANPSHPLAICRDVYYEVRTPQCFYGVYDSIKDAYEGLEFWKKGRPDEFFFIEVSVMKKYIIIK